MIAVGGDPAAVAGEDQRPDRGHGVRPRHPGRATSAATPVVIPNGRLRRPVRRRAEPRPEWRGRRRRRSASSAGSTSPARASRCCWRPSARSPRHRPGLRLLVVGGGDVDEARGLLPPEVRDQVTFLGVVSDEDKAAALRTVDVYVAPNTGGESFGIVLVEAMAAGATVLASDIDAFRRVLDDGRGRRAVRQRGRRRPRGRGWPRCWTTPRDGRSWTRPRGTPYAATTGRRSPGRSCASTRRVAEGSRS